MRYSVALTAAAAEDFRQLHGSLKDPVARSSEHSKPPHDSASFFGNRAGLDLPATTNSTPPKIMVEVGAIGKREDLAVYQEALKRLNPRD